MEETQDLLPNISSECVEHGLPRRHSFSSNEKFGAKVLPYLTLAKFTLGLLTAIILQYWIRSIIICITCIICWIFVGFWVTVVLIVFSLIGCLYKISDQLVYWPIVPPESRRVVVSPASIGLPTENLYVYCQDGTKLHCVFVKQDSHLAKSVPTFVYFHGNAGNIGHRLANVYELYQHLKVNIFLVEYRGFGLSQGSPSESGLYEDAQAAISYIRTRTDINLDHIVLFGRSLGGAVAIDCASQMEMKSRIAALIVENTFSSIPDMTKTMFSTIPVLPSLPVWCHKNKYNSKHKMCRIMTPTLLLSGLSDNLVPPSMMLQLYHACASPAKKLYQFPSGTHNETWRSPGYYQTIAGFLNEVFYQAYRSNDLPPGVICVSESQLL